MQATRAHLLRCVSSLIVLLLLMSVCATWAVAAVPDLRDQVSLNGAWTQGGTVPDYSPQDTKFDHRTYSRTITVPAAWSGKRVSLAFNAVNFACDVYLNDAKLGSHVGAWVPFSFDISGKVAAGASATLRVEVHGMNVAPTTVDGKVMWWIGYNDLDGYRAGIVDDVWLRAYGQVHITDAFIKPSVRNKTLTVEWTVRNRSSSSWTGTVAGDVVRESTGATVKTIASAGFTLAAGAERLVSATIPWTDAALWWPDQPVLHLLKSRVASGSTVHDRETRRFGFREFWITGKQYRLNGIRINLRGDWCAFSQYWGAINSVATLRTHYEGVKAANANILRWHKHPPPQFALDLADEMGLMIQSETAVYGRPYMNHALKDQAISNMITLIPSWMKATRNHAAVVCWSATNEATYSGLAKYSAAQCQRIRDAMIALDPTRPVLNDGDDKYVDCGGVIKSMHYLEPYEQDPTGDPYSAWAGKLDANRPTHLGEILAVRPGENQNGWWIGVWPRGLRALEYAHICPRVYYAGSRITDAQEALQAAAYHPIALFDKGHDQLGIAPHKDGTLPQLGGGTPTTRSLYLYNDDYRGTRVTVAVEARVDGVLVASGTRDYEVALGAHTVIPCGLQVPKRGGRTLVITRRTAKGGTVRFEEASRFAITGDASGGATSSAISLGGDPVAVAPVITTQPVARTVDAGQTATFTVAATGTPAPVFRWQRNGVDIAGATAASHTTPAATAADHGAVFRCVATNSAGSATSTAVALTVNRPPTVAWTSPTGATTCHTGGRLRLVVAASDADGTIASVEFLADGQVIQTERSAPYDWIWTGLEAGTHAITARATDDRGVTTTSVPIAVTVRDVFAARINFQPAAATPVTGWSVDDGAPYATHGTLTYGWNIDVGSTTRDRNATGSADQLVDTLVHMQKPGLDSAYWEIAVPDGIYQVRLVAGDPQFFDSRFRIAVEGIAAIDGTPTATGRWLDRTVTVTVNDGRLSITSLAGADNNKLCLVAIDEVVPAPVANG